MRTLSINRVILVLTLILTAGALLLTVSGCSAPAEVAEDVPEPTATVFITAEPILVDLVAKETPTPEPAMTLPPTPSPTPEPQLSGKIVGIDPGHQLTYNPSKEPIAPKSTTMKEKVAGGCRGVKSRIYEYEVNLAVGLALRDLLEADGATVVMTRTTQDVNISNSERAIMFNDANVDIGIRIHCDKSGDSAKRGVHMLIPKDYRTGFYAENQNAAQCVLNRFVAVTVMPQVKGTGISERGDQTGFNWCTRPVIGIEMGYLSNVEDDALLSDPEFQKLCAKGLYEGLRAYLLKIDPSVDPVSDIQEPAQDAAAQDSTAVPEELPAVDGAEDTENTGE